VGILCGGAAVLLTAGYTARNYNGSPSNNPSSYDASHDYIGFSPRGENVLAADRDGLKRVRVWDENGKFYLDEKISPEIWDNSQSPPLSPENKIVSPIAQTFIFEKPLREGDYTIEVTDTKNNIQTFRKYFKPEK